MAKVGSLLIDLGLNMARLHTDVGKANQRIQSMERNFSKSLKGIERQFNQVRKSVRGFAGTLGLVVGGGGVVAFIKSQIDAADRIQKLNARLNISQQALFEYKHVAELSGVTFDNLTLAFQRMGRRVSDAAVGAGEAQGALRELNLDAEFLTRLQLDQQYELIADAISQLSDENRKAAIAQKIFDSEGVATLQTMTNGAKGIREMRSEARALNGDFKSTGDASAKINDSLTRMKRAMESLAFSVIPKLEPAFTFLAENAATVLGPAIQSVVLAFHGLNAVTAFLGGGLAGALGFDDDSVKLFERAEFSIKEIQKTLGLVKDKSGEKSLSGLEIPPIEGIAPPPQVFPESYLADLRAQMGTIDNILSEGWVTQLEALQTSMDDMRFIQADAFQAGLIGFEEYQRNLTLINEHEAMQRQKIEERATASITALRESFTNNAVSLLQTLGQKNKAAAIAAVLIQKAQAIQSINIERAKALQAARVWSYLYGYAADAKFAQAAAQINTLAAANMGLVAATGIAEIQNINSGAGTSTGGVPPSSNTVGGSSSQAPQQQVVQQVIIQGDVYGIEEFEDRVVQANRSFIRREGILIEKNTRQALEFARG